MVKVKICGLKYPHNIGQLTEIKPDYMGFIFYAKSPRFCEGFFEPEQTDEIPSTIKKVGVFVNESIYTIVNIVKKYSLDLVQLHGNESPEFCKELKDKGLSVIKTFHVDSNFNFQNMNQFKPYCDYFLFDSKSPLYGGSGKQFDWTLLAKYDNDKPIFLSGGIDLEDIEKIKNYKNINIHAIDINSKFETAPAMKDVRKIEEFMKLIHEN